MANLSLLLVLLVTALCVQGWTHEAKQKTKEKREKVLRDMLEDELLNWRKMEAETEQLLELREASGDSDDTDESGEPEESDEGEDAGAEFVIFVKKTSVFCNTHVKVKLKFVF